MIKNMKVGAILQTGFFVGSMVGASMAGLGVYSMHQMNNAAAQLYSSDLMSISHIKEANINMGIVARSVRSVMLAPTAEMRAKSKDTLAKAITDTEKSLALADTTVDDDESKRLLDEVDAKVKMYFDTVAEVQKRVDADGETVSKETINLLLVDGVKAIREANTAFDKLTALTQDNAHKAADDNQKLYERNRLIMLIVVMLSTLSGFAAGILISRRITGQLGGEPDYAANIAKEISSGNLNVDVELRKGDTSSLLHAMKNMRDSLVNIVSEVRIGTDAIDTAAKQIADGNMDLSGRTEQQASSLEETAASMEELTSTVKQNADNARQANNLASSAATVAVRGGEVINEVVTTMGAINDASRKVVDIISVIDGIAFQTNILALNAAVEAARAGEQGRGFAVVASEVRALAQRSAAAAKEIKGLIATSVERVESGSALVDQAGSTMSEIVTSITRVNDIMSEITAASLEQTSGIEQVNEAVMQMDSTTQQNAALVEEAAAAAESLREQADKLVSTVAFFKLENSNNAARIVRSEPLLRPLTKEVATPNAKASPVLKPKVTPPARPSAPATVKPVLPKTKASSSMNTALPKDDKEDWEEF